ncbi:AAA domain-containing protein [Dendryphion nanum]|uniref:AAA domain-containing protein n=1 Tax=Dendryphion nanum TaxID=256645 RepID=A0A9P9ILT4_9PLEO|nr:AAA domain-containing protein [Dendryphion nanum]
MSPSKDPPRNIYIIGAQSTGKTTLAEALSASLSTSASTPPTIIREIARSIILEKGYNRAEMTTSPDRALQLQQDILEAQYRAERAVDANLSSSGYICDRSGLDPIVYARLYVSENAADEMFASVAWRELEMKMRCGVVILCEAGGSWLVDDGLRLMPEGLEDWLRVDGMFRMLLGDRRIAYTVVPKEVGCVGERVGLVMDAVQQCGKVTDGVGLPGF